MQKMKLILILVSMILFGTCVYMLFSFEDINSAAFLWLSISYFGLIFIFMFLALFFALVFNLILCIRDCIFFKYLFAPMIDKKFEKWAYFYNNNNNNNLFGLQRKMEHKKAFLQLYSGTQIGTFSLEDIEFLDEMQAMSSQFGVNSINMTTRYYYLV